MTPRIDAERRYDLDWLRVIAFALLMLFHTGMMFSVWDWHVKNLETSESLSLIMGFLHSWRMPLLFFISGSAIWFAMDRYSTWKYFLERHKRLLLPLVFGMLVVIPPQIYVERLYHHQHYDSFLDFYRTVFTSGSYPEGNLSWHHLWYIPYIWTYSMLTLPLFVWLRSRAGRRLLDAFHHLLERPGLVYLVFLPSFLSDAFVRPFYPGDAMNLFDDWGNLCHKLTFFLVGFLLASGVKIYDRIASQRTLTLGMAVVLTAALYLLDWRVRATSMSLYRGAYNLSIWLWILAALGYARHYLSFNSPVLRYCTDAVYPFYVLHQTIIIMLAYPMVFLSWNIPAKFLLVVTVTFLIAWLIYEFIIKPWNPLRVAFGMKWKSRTRREPVPTPGLSPRLPTGTLGISALVLLGCLLAGCSRRTSGELLVYQFDAPSLSSNLFRIPERQELAVYLPPGYGQGNQRYPVLYLLPNYNACLYRYTGGFFQGWHTRDSMDYLIREGRIHEMILVMPNAVNSLGGCWYENSPLTGNWENYVVDDVRHFVETRFRTIQAPAGRAIAGHGMGGVGALSIALKHPDLFGGVYALSPAVFDAAGLRDSGLLSSDRVRRLTEASANWAGENARHNFRDYMHQPLNSSSRERFFDALALSYGAAFASDLSRPFPHIALPRTGVENDGGVQNLYERGFGQWDRKLSQYLSGKARVNSITLECAGPGEYEWIRRGVNDLSERMGGLGMPHQLESHKGDHESLLRERIETAMLPALSRALAVPQ